MSLKHRFTAIIIAVACFAPSAGAVEALPQNIAVNLERAAQVNRQPNDVLALAVVSAIAEQPQLLESIMAKALQLAPQDRIYLIDQAVQSFPGHAQRIMAAANYSPPQAKPQRRQPIYQQAQPRPYYQQAPPQPYYQPQPQPRPSYQTPATILVPQPQQAVPQKDQLASTPPDVTKKGWYGISEIRGGILKHAFKFTHRAKERGIDGNLEVLFLSPEWLKMLWEPRFHIGSNFNDRDKDIEQFYGGLTWEWGFWGSTFFDFSLGMTVHNGVNNTDSVNGVSPPDAGRVRELGCKVLFRESFELGYRFFDTHSVSAMWDHISNGGICSKENEGMDNLGVRYGYRF